MENQISKSQIQDLFNWYILVGIVYTLLLQSGVGRSSLKYDVSVRILCLIIRQEHYMIRLDNWIIIFSFIRSLGNYHSISNKYYYILFSCEQQLKQIRRQENFYSCSLAKTVLEHQSRESSIFLVTLNTHYNQPLNVDNSVL